MLPWTHPSPHRKRHLDRFSRFCRAHDRDRQTDRQVDHANTSVTIGHIYVRSTRNELEDSMYKAKASGPWPVVLKVKANANASDYENTRSREK